MRVSSFLVAGLLLSTASAGDPLWDGESAGSGEALVTGEELHPVMALEQDVPSRHHNEAAPGQLSGAEVELKAATLLEAALRTPGPDGDPAKIVMKRSRRTNSSEGRRKRKGKVRRDETTEGALDSFSRVFTTAKKSFSRVSRRMYAKGEDYWRDPRRRRALMYFAVVALLMVIVAYAQHRENIVQIEMEELGEQQALVELMEEEVDEELGKIQDEMAESATAREAQRQEEKSLQAREEELRMMRDLLRDRVAGLQQEQSALSIREAKAQLSASYEETEAAGISEPSKAAKEKLKEIKEEANRLFWEGHMWRAGDRAAMSDLSLLEAEVRAKYHTLLRVMAVEDRSPSMQEQVLLLKEELSDAMIVFEVQVRAAMRSLTDDAWVADAEQEILKDRKAKQRLLKKLEKEWESHAAHQAQMLHMLEAERRKLLQRRKEIQIIKEQLEDPQSVHRDQLSDRLFCLLSAELYQRSFVSVLDAEVAVHLDREAWMSKMRQLVEEAEVRVQERHKSWATPTAAQAELRGKIMAIDGLMESLQDKINMCFNIHQMWQSKWGIEG